MHSFLFLIISSNVSHLGGSSTLMYSPRNRLFNAS